jgi:hypothetical protein
LALASTVTLDFVGDGTWEVIADPYVVLNTADAIYLGTTPATKVYLGSEQVWP